MYQMAAYCRLSKDDGENRVSESIENQLKMIREYVSQFADLEIAGIYVDDGYSGLYFENRPEFQRMMEDIYRGHIQGVITKDISRLGREHIATSNYIERVFPSLGIRYIAILDGLDSISHNNEELAQFKTLFNDMYSRDISKKIKGSLNAQKKRGDFMSGFAPYGYIRNPENKHQLVVDEEAACIVRKIYRLFLSGYSRDGIAKKLNEEGIMTPSEYKRNVQGLKYNNAVEKPGKKGWAYPTISTVLKNRVYTGAMVQNKTEKVSYKIDKFRYIPEEEQCIVEGTHEAIISKDTYQQVQEIMKKRTRTPGFFSENRKVNPYAGILVCGDCGCNMQRVTCRDGYDCGTYHKKGNALCSSHFIKKSILDSIVRNEIQRQGKRAWKEDDKDDILKSVNRKWKKECKCAETDKKIKRMQEQLIRIQKYKKKTYENYVDAILDKEEYLSYKTEYGQQEQDVKEKLERLEREKQEQWEKERQEQWEKEKQEQSERGRNSTGVVEENHETWVELFIKHGELKEITREIIVELVNKIVVYGDNRIEIEFKYQSPYAA